MYNPKLPALINLHSEKSEVQNKNPSGSVIKQ